MVTWVGSGMVRYRAKVYFEELGDVLVSHWWYVYTVTCDTRVGVSVVRCVYTEYEIWSITFTLILLISYLIYIILLIHVFSFVFHLFTCFSFVVPLFPFKLMIFVKLNAIFNISIWVNMQKGIRAKGNVFIHNYNTIRTYILVWLATVISPK